MRTPRLFPLLASLLCLQAVAAFAQSPADTDESAYAASTLARIFGGAARSQNDEAELVGRDQWFTTTANFTGRKRPISGRYRPIIGAWVSSRGEDASTTEMYFSGELSELEFEQGGKRYWILAGLPGGLGFDVYPPGQSLAIYLQRVGFASGTPVVVLTLAKPGGGATPTTAPKTRVMRNARVGEGARRQEGTYKSGTATFTYAGREYSLPLDLAGRHSIAPGFYSYENGVRTALLEYGSGDAQYLLLRVSATGGAEPAGIVPYLVLNGRIVPPIDLAACVVDIEQSDGTRSSGRVDCAAVTRAVFSKLQFSATSSAP